MTTRTRKFKVGDTYEGDGKDLPVRTIIVDRDGDMAQKRQDGKWLRGYQNDHQILSYPGGVDKKIVYLPEVKVPSVGQVIRTAEEFEVLPPKSVVQDEDGDVFQRGTHNKDSEYWYLPGHVTRYADETMTHTVGVPFTVLFVGTAE